MTTGIELIMVDLLKDDRIPFVVKKVVYEIEVVLGAVDKSDYPIPYRAEKKHICPTPIDDPPIVDPLSLKKNDNDL